MDVELDIDAALESLQQLPDYPAETFGSKLAAKIRQEANGLSPEERARLLREAMARISGGDS